MSKKIRIELDDKGGPSKPEKAVATLPCPMVRRNMTRPTELRFRNHLTDKIFSHMEEDGFMESFEAYLLGKASEIVYAEEFFASLVQLNVLEEIKQETGPEVEEGRQVEIAMKVACSKRAIASLLLALQSSNNDRILLEICIWLETFPARNMNCPSLAIQPRPAERGIFVATQEGLISLDLDTSEATALTSKATIAVAVNHKLKKVYWTEGEDPPRMMRRGFAVSADGEISTPAGVGIMRSNFNMSDKEVIIRPTENGIDALAVDDPSGNLYFAPWGSNKIKVWYALDRKIDVVICHSSLVDSPIGIALDSAKGFMYWGNCGSRPHSIVRADLNGSNPKIISTEFNDLTGIALGQPSNDVLYWADAGENTIGTVDVNGGNKRILVKLEGRPDPWGLQVDAYKIYIGTWCGKNFQTVDRDSGTTLKTICNFTGCVSHLALF